VRIDLHAHSTASDGSVTPAALVTSAAQAGLDVLALTDHDTTQGMAEAVAALPPGLTLVPGAEISCAIPAEDGHPDERVSVHLLAYLFDPAEPEFAAERDRLVDDRVPRAQGMVARLNALGVDVGWGDVLRVAGGAPIGRPHLAQLLVDKGVVPDVPSAFTPDWLATGGRAYVPKHASEPLVAVGLVRLARGVAVLAHPGASGRGPGIPDAVVGAMAAAGLFGLEADHVEHDEPTRERYRSLARDLGLACTGGSDFHGARKPGIALGARTTEPDVYARLVAAASGASPVTA
jgi:predicted metal-dependent phosphoesterase TrpH